MLGAVTDLLSQVGVPDAIREAGAMNYLGQVIYTQGNMLGYRDSFFIVSAIFVIAILPAFMMRQRPVRQVIETNER